MYFTIYRILLTLLLIVLSSGVLCQTPTIIPEEATMNFSEIAKKHGHITEEYDIISEDGYILKTFRIPGDSSRPLLLIHGAIDSSDSFILRGNTSLAIAAARKNYDVWAMNYRGNPYSRRHNIMNPDSDEAYWDFSVHEFGYYDIPATIDFILDKTGEHKLSVIGYSEGTAAMYVMGATRPKYNDKIKILISLAPICYLHNTRSFMNLLLKLWPYLNLALEAIHSNEIVGHSLVWRALIDEFCAHNNTGYNRCLLNGIFLVTGSDADEIEPEFYPIIIGHFPSGTSRKNLNHLMQISHTRKFVNYNYGLMQNMVIYKRLTPPEYDLSKVTMNVALFVAKNDQISTIKDVALLRKRLPNVVDYRVMENNVFNHVDYIWGRNTHKTMYPHIFRLLQKYT